MSVGQAEGRMVTFQDDESLKALRKGAGLHELLVAVGAVTLETFQFLGVGGEDDTLRHLLQPSTMIGQDVDGVGIDDNRTLTASDLCDYGDGRLLIGAQTWTDTQGVVVFRLDGLREDGLVAVELNDSLRHTHLHDHVVLLGRVGRHLSCTSSQTGLGGQYGGASHAVTAGDDKGVAHIALVGVGIPFQEQGTDVVFFDQRVVGLDFIHALLTEADVQYLQSSDILLVLGEEERQLLLLQGERQVGAHDIGADIIGVVIRHQT